MAHTGPTDKSQHFFVVFGLFCLHNPTQSVQTHPTQRTQRFRHSLLGTMNGNNNGNNGCGSDGSGSDGSGGGQILRVEGTNVLRVPFGVRMARRARPQRPDHWATLVLPFQGHIDPTPPPQAA